MASWKNIFEIDIIYFSDNVNCPEGNIGPQCLFSCHNDLSSDFDCKGTKICYENGCTCAPGYLGDHCSRCK